MDRITIIGTAYGHEDAPLDYIGEVWGITTLAPKKRTKVNRVIDMNKYDDLRWGEGQLEGNRNTIEWCKKTNTPYIGLHNYPIKKIVKRFLPSLRLPVFPGIGKHV